MQDKWKQVTKNDNTTAEEVWKEIKEIYTEAAQQVLGYQKTRKKTSWISQEVLKLSDQRREMRSRKEHCEENRKLYSKLTTEFKKKAKQCYRHKINDSRLTRQNGKFRGGEVGGRPMHWFSQYLEK